MGDDPEELAGRITSREEMATFLDALSVDANEHGSEWENLRISDVLESMGGVAPRHTRASLSRISSPSSGSSRRICWSPVSITSEVRAPARRFGAFGYSERMLVTYDPSANAAYIYLDPSRRGTAAAAETVPLESLGGPGGGPSALHSITLDFDREGRLFGIEVLSAETVLPATLLGSAERD